MLVSVHDLSLYIDHFRIMADLRQYIVHLSGVATLTFLIQLYSRDQRDPINEFVYAI